MHVDCVWNVMAHAQKLDFVFRWNGRFPLNRRGRQFSRLLAAEVCTSAVVVLDTPCSEVVWRVLATHSIRQFPLYFPSHASPCAITFQLDCTFVSSAVPVCDRALSEVCQAMPVCPVKSNMQVKKSMQYCWNDDNGKRKHSEKNLSQCHFDHHKPHSD
jgi:hypothetical protein